MIKNRNIAETVKYAGKIMLSGYTTAKAKEDGSFVTDADISVQEFLIRNLPDISFISEEKENQKLPDECFIIDPIDGTHNYMNGIPICAVCFAYAKDKRIEDAYVYNPFLDQFFSAGLGEGAYLNENRIIHGPVLPLNKTVLLTESWKRFDYNVFMNKLLKFRCLGSAELGFCYAAMSSGVYISHRIRLWDYAAGMLIAREAGLEVFNIDGVDADLQDFNEIAVCPYEQKERILCLWRDARRMKTLK